MINISKKTLIGALTAFCFLFGGCVSACDKINADDPQFTGGTDSNNKDENNNNESDDPSTDDPSTDDPSTDDPSGDNPGTEDPSQDDPNFTPAPDLYTVIIPEDIPSQTKMYEGFFLSFNKDNHTPNYVTWELLAREVGGSISRTDNFHKDPELEGCPDENAYKGSGYDRGHMCPAADQKWSALAMNDCFVMSNMCPQAPALNQKAWETLESKCRNWAKRDGAIWIVSGPIYYDTDQQTIGSYKVRVPGAFFKVLLAKDIEKPRAIAFVYPNMAATGNMEDYAMSVDDLEKEIGYDFFSALPDDIEDEVEATFSFAEWNK